MEEAVVELNPFVEAQNDIMMAGVPQRPAEVHTPGFIVSYHIVPILFDNPHVQFRATMRPFVGTINDAPTDKPGAKCLPPSILTIPDRSIPFSVLDNVAPAIITTTGIEIAQGFVRDYLNSIPDVDPRNGSAPAVVAYHTNKIPFKILKGLFDAQVQYARYLVSVADMFHAKREFDGISEIHRAAAKFLNLTVRWDSEILTGAVKRCIACTELINSAARICPRCHAPQDDRLLDSWMNSTYTRNLAPPVPSATAPVTK